MQIESQVKDDLIKEFLKDGKIPKKYKKSRRLQKH